MLAGATRPPVAVRAVAALARRGLLGPEGATTRARPGGAARSRSTRRARAAPARSWASRSSRACALPCHTSVYTGPRAMTASSPSRAAHPYYMHDAIYAQPGVLRLVERGNETALSAAAGALRGASRVWLAGVGSSWHAALVGEHLLAGLGQLRAQARAVVASEWTAYGPPPEPGEALVAMSHRGSRVAAEAGTPAAGRGAVPLRVTRQGVPPPGGPHALP